MPEGQLVLQAPPELAPHEGAGGALMMALPMLGSVGSIVFVAAAQPRRQEHDRRRHVPGRDPRLRRRQHRPAAQAARRQGRPAPAASTSSTSAGVRKVVREAAAQQRRSLLWHHPDPASLPALAEDRARLWERTPDSPQHLQVRYGLTSQPLALELVPPETAPDRAARPGRRLRAAPAARRAPGAARPARRARPARLQPDRGHRRRPSRPGRWPGRWSARRRRSTPPSDLVVAVLATDETLPEWDWLKWLPHAQSTEDSDAVGPSRMVTTSLDDLAAMLPADLADRPRFGADQRAADPARPGLVDGGHAAARQPPDPRRGRARRHRARPARALGRARRPHPAAAAARAGAAARRPGRRHRAAGARGADPGRGRPVDLASAEAFARRLAPLHTAEGRSARTRSPAPPTSCDCSASATCAPSTWPPAWQPRPARDRLRVPVGVGDAGGAGPPRHQGVRPAGHGPARPGDRRDRLRQVGVPAHPGARPGDDALARGAQHGARRLQGRRDLRRARRTCRTSRR